ncbi:MAG: 2,3-dihydroxybiphenyl 1,2-dioxygenase, partial [Gammaproteobacteria bacterium]|nr:2,3-dihydroxybiphenyl 1,2-dioxygenase [Gammaproteobacteria bacterium]
MMHYTQLGYIGITASDTGAWRTFAGEYLGMQVVDGSDGGLALRMDERRHRILIEPAQDDGLAFLGLETSGPEQLEAAATRLQAQG